MTPAVVVIAYDRPHALQRLLASLATAAYPEDANVPLVISIDRGSSPGVAEVVAQAKAFAWGYGPKKIVEQPEHLGVVGHFRAAGKLAAEHGSGILLEEDLSVAPPFYAFASQALATYADDERITGVCLYDLWFNGFTQLPFRPLDDGGDVYFIGVPYTQGLAFTARQWRGFEDWWQANGAGVEPHPALHPSFLRFGPDEWSPALASYMARTGRYLCFPRGSLTTAWGEPGAHFEARTGWLLAPVQLRGGPYRLPALDESLAVYDGFFELTVDRLKTLAPGLPDVEFDVDTNGTKQREDLRSGHVVTLRPARRALRRFGLQLQPPELNVIQDVEGDQISLAAVEDVYWDRWGALEARRRLETLAWSKRRPSRRRSLSLLAARVVDRLRRHGVVSDSSQGRGK